MLLVQTFLMYKKLFCRHILVLFFPFLHRLTQVYVSGEKADEEKKCCDSAELLIRKLLKCNNSSKGDNLPEYQEAFLRECVREFPFRESSIFRQMVATLASSEPPSAISVVLAAINGQRGFAADYSETCVTCGAEKATKKCSKCKAVQYCDRECQRLHWFIHKKSCARPGNASCSAKLSDADKESLGAAIACRLKDMDVR